MFVLPGLADKKKRRERGTPWAKRAVGVRGGDGEDSHQIPALHHVIKKLNIKARTIATQAPASKRACRTKGS
jgi:hypothetical protein